MSSNVLPGEQLAGVAPRRGRQLRPEIAARMAERKRIRPLAELYEKSVAELSPEELSQMKAAFFRAG